MEIPDDIVNAVNVLLAPYGETFVPGNRRIEQGVPRLLSTEEVMGMLRTSRSTVDRLARDGILTKYHPTPTRACYDLNEVAAYLRKTRAKP